MDLAKGLMVIGGMIVGGAALAVAPVLTVSAPLWGVMGTSYTVNSLAVAGVAAAAAAGIGAGKVAGQTGGALIIQGLDQVSQRLLDKVSSSKTKKD